MLMIWLPTFRALACKPSSSITDKTVSATAMETGSLRYCTRITINEGHACIMTDEGCGGACIMTGEGCGGACIMTGEGCGGACIMTDEG